MATIFAGAAAYAAALTRRGFVRLGGGYFSQVYAKPGCAKVVKVCFKADEDVWADYAEWAFHNPGPMVPRVWSLKWHVDFCVAVLDRMTETVEDAHDNGTSRNHYVARAFVKPLDARWGAHGRAEPVARALDKDGYAAEAALLMTLEAVFPKHYFDVHAANWMFDATGKLILTDPFSESNSLPRRVRLSLPRAA